MMANKPISWLSLVFVYGLELLLLIVTSAHTVNLIKFTLPADQQILGYIALVAFDAGLIGWTWTYMYGARGKQQRGISISMIVVSLLGIGAAYFTDLFLQTGQKGLTTRPDPFLISSVVFVMGAVVIGNIAAAVVFHITDPDYSRQQAEEEARDEIEQEALKLIRRQAPTLAAQLAPHVAQDWMQQMIRQQLAGLNISAQLPQAQAQAQQMQLFQAAPPPPPPSWQDYEPLQHIGIGSADGGSAEEDFTRPR